MDILLAALSAIFTAGATVAGVRVQLHSIIKDVERHEKYHEAHFTNIKRLEVQHAKR